MDTNTRRWDTNKWKEEVITKSTLSLYATVKDRPEEIKWYRNGIKFSLLMQARADALNLGWRGFEADKSKLCKTCINGEDETLLHFILECPRLEMVRGKYMVTQLPRIESSRKLLRTILLLDDNHDDMADTMARLIYNLWEERRKVQKSLQRN